MSTPGKIQSSSYLVLHLNIDGVRKLSLQVSQRPDMIMLGNTGEVGYLLTKTEYHEKGFETND